VELKQNNEIGPSKMNGLDVSNSSSVQHMTLNRLRMNGNFKIGATKTAETFLQIMMLASK